MKKEAIIVDLDGTLCNCEHRRHFVTGPKKDWKSFYESMSEDPINAWCERIIRSFYTIFVTGRPEEYRELTMDWLRKYWLVPNVMMVNINGGGHTKKECPMPLLMRKNGDFRDDAIIKEEIYKAEIEPYYDIIFVLDDRKKVVDMWRGLGLTVLHCADGDF